ncbi:MAG: hypothetical protein NVSMB63_18200 [Sediminibacterium sp.]
MKREHRINGHDAAEIVALVFDDIAAVEEEGNYSVRIEQGGQEIFLELASSPGGGFEGGYELTTLRSVLPGRSSFRFAIHPQDFLYEIGKFFGVEDVTIGYADFDKNVTVKTNDPVRFRHVFASAEVREVFQSLSGYSLEIKGQGEVAYMEMAIQRIIPDAGEFLRIYHAFYQVLTSLPLVTA